jgi:hypothetical protein
MSYTEYGDGKWLYYYIKVPHYELEGDSPENPSQEALEHRERINELGKNGGELTAVTAVDGIFTLFFKFKGHTVPDPAPTPLPLPAQPANNDQEDKKFASLINEMREESKLLLEMLQKQIELQQKQIELLQKQTTNQPPVPVPPANDKQDDKRVASVINEIREVRTLLFEMQQKKPELQLHPLVSKWHYQETRSDYLEEYGEKGWEFVCFNPEGREGKVLLKRPAQLQSFVMERDYPFLIS